MSANKAVSAHEARLKMKEVITSAEHQGQVVDLMRWGKVAASVVRSDVGELVGLLGMDEAFHVLRQAVDGRGEGGAAELSAASGMTIGSSANPFSFLSVTVDGDVIKGRADSENGVVVNLDEMEQA